MIQLGKYQLVAEIARGGMGIVYLAVAQGPARFSKLLVVKELKPELVDDPTFLEMFLEEARLAARLSHPNIVQTYEIGAEGKRHYIVMDYLEGVTLARVLRKKDERFTLHMQLRVICEALQGLQYAHSLTDFDGTPLGIVHRDATPQNVFITFDGTVKLVDFGIAKALDSTVETRTGVLKGKPAYMAPEQISGDVDPRADVFTVGVMIWEAAAGRRMWHKKGDVEVLTNIIKGQMPSLKEVAPNAPDALVRIVEKAVAKDKDVRYASAADLQADLEAYLVAEKAHITPREVGKLVADMFSEERTTTRSTIEAHLAQVKTGKTNDGKLPSLHPPAGDTGTPSGNRPASLAGLTPTGGTPLSGATPSPAEVPNDARLEVEAQKFAAKRQKIIGAAAIVGGILVVGIIIGLTRKKEQPVAITAPPETAAAGGPAAKAPDQPPPPTTVIATATAHEISVKVIPSNATVTFDGKDMSNPARKTCQTGSRVLLRASANGYIPRERELRCEQDESLELVLQPMGLAAAPPPPPPRAATGAKTTPAQPPVAAADPPKPPPPAPPTRSPNEVNPNGGTRPNRPIDTSSPYGN